MLTVRLTFTQITLRTNQKEQNIYWKVSEKGIIEKVYDPLFVRINHLLDLCLHLLRLEIQGGTWVVSRRTDERTKTFVVQYLFDRSPFPRSLDQIKN